ncbi:unnamed protein product, partial [Adineta ricciae]
TTEQSRLNYEEQNQYKIRVQFINKTQFIEESYLIEIEDINEPPYNLHYSHQTGFCTVLDEDFHQTLKFHVKTIEKHQNGTDFEIICTDDGHPPLSISTRINVISDEISLMFVPVALLIIPIIDENITMAKSMRDVSRLIRHHIHQ